MSRVKLGNIGVNRSTPVTRDYVGAIVDSDSGYLVPKLFTSTDLLNTILGDFPYKCLYEELITRDIPACLMPVITKESNYNRPSLRLSNGMVQVSYPKYEKEYKSVLLGNVIEKPFTDEDLIDGELIINHNLDFYPICSIAILDNSTYSVTEVKTLLTYSEHTIKISFQDKLKTPINKGISGTVTIESFPQLNNDEYVRIGYFNSNQGTYKMYLDEPIIPELVVTSAEQDDRLGVKVEVNTLLNPNPVDDGSEFNGKYELSITPILTDSIRFRVDTRIVPSSLMISRNGLTTNSIFHDSNRNPVFKLEKDNSIAWGKIEFKTQNYSVIELSNPNNTIIRYNIITTQDDFDFNLISTGQMVMNLVLDFSNVEYKDLIKRGNIYESSNYIIIRNATQDALIRTGEYVDVSTTYYNTEAIYTTEEGIGDTELDKKLDTINKIRIWYREKYQNTCTNLRDRINLFVDDYLKRVGVPVVDQFNNQVFIDEWKSLFLEQIYVEDFWLAYNQEVADLLLPILDKFTPEKGITYDPSYDHDDVSEDRKINDNLRYEIDQLNIVCDKLLFEYTVPVSDLNFYKLPNLFTDSLFNLTQDKLCEFSESDKVIEFYSTIKGSSGKNTIIKISEVNFYPGIYEISITNGSIFESYIVKLYEVENCPLDAKFITDIDKESDLVRIKYYNCRLNGKLIDFRDFNLKGDLSDYTEDEINSLFRNKSELKLPIGTFVLDRVTPELVTYEDRLNSIDIYKKSDWYPDLFLVDQLPDRPSYVKSILDLVSWNEDKDQSIFSQALIKLNGYHLYSNQKLFNENNRILYFYEDLDFNGEAYPVYLDYIENIIRSKYLNLPSTQLTYLPFEFKLGNYIILTSKNQAEHKCVKITRLVGDYIELYHKVVGKDYIKDELILGRFDSKSLKLKVISNPNQVVNNIDQNYDYTYQSVNKYLIDNHINYLDFNNLYYYYTTLSETLNQPSIFIIQYITSKITREVYKNEYRMTGISYGELCSILNEIKLICLTALPLLSSLTVESTLNGNSVNVIFTAEIKSLTNKLFTIDFILNV